MRIPAKPLAALLATEFAFASLAATGKLAVAEIPPMTVAAVRVLVGGAFLSAIALSVQRERVDRKDAGKLVGLAILGVVLNQAGFLLGLQRTTATNASILITTIPIFTVLVALILRRERAIPLRLAGIAVAFSGVALLVRLERFDLSSDSTVGDLLILFNSFSFAFYLVLSRGLLRRYRSTTVVMWTFLFAGIFLVPVGAGYAAGTDWSAVGAVAWGALVWVVLVGTVAAYALNTYALKRLDSSTVAAFIFLQPLIGVSLAVVLLGETVTSRAIAGGALVLAGLLMVTRTESQAVAPTDVGLAETTPEAARGREPRTR